jgi:phosphoglycolate phosphatase-like HAD superfamily hydrolase
MKNIALIFYISIFLFSCNNENKQSIETNTTNDSVTIKTDTVKIDTTTKKTTSKHKTATTKKIVKKENNTKTVQKNIKKKTYLKSWNNTKTKKRIINFVNDITNPNSTNYIKPKYRIATFDNDGTLWPEKPTFFQIEFVIYRINKMAPNHPEWNKNRLIQTVLKHDLETLREKYGVNGLIKLINITQEGMTTDEFENTVHDWIENSTHPETGKPYKDLIYQPMQELTEYLQDNDFKVYIVTNAGTDFTRAIVKDLFNIPEENVIGSIQRLEYKKINNKPSLIKTRDLLIVNDGNTKPMMIRQIIGKKPILAIGNGDNDIEMLEWCNSNKYKNLSGFVHHTDSVREWAYDRKSNTGLLNNGLDLAVKNNWLLIDIEKDWLTIYPSDLKN